MRVVLRPEDRGRPVSTTLIIRTTKGQRRFNCKRPDATSHSSEVIITTFTTSATMSKLSPGLKALINAPFARPNQTPAPARIRGVYQAIASDAARRNVGLKPWVVLCVCISSVVPYPKSHSPNPPSRGSISCPVAVSFAKHPHHRAQPPLLSTPPNP